MFNNAICPSDETQKLMIDRSSCILHHKGDVTQHRQSFICHLTCFCLLADWSCRLVVSCDYLLLVLTVSEGPKQGTVHECPPKTLECDLQCPVQTADTEQRRSFAQIIHCGLHTDRIGLWFQPLQIVLSHYTMLLLLDCLPLTDWFYISGHLSAHTKLMIHTLHLIKTKASHLCCPHINFWALVFTTCNNVLVVWAPCHPRHTEWMSMEDSVFSYIVDVFCVPDNDWSVFRAWCKSFAIVRKANVQDLHEHNITHSLFPQLVCYRRTMLAKSNHVSSTRISWTDPQPPIKQ